MFVCQTPQMDRGLLGRKLLGLAFMASATVHFLHPQPFEAIVPKALPAPGAIVKVSGVAEVACGVGLLADAASAGLPSAALLVAVFPANVQMAVNWQRDPDRSNWMKALAWLRLPLQIPLIAIALSKTSRPGFVKPRRTN